MLDEQSLKFITHVRKIDMAREEWIMATTQTFLLRHAGLARAQTIGIWASFLRTKQINKWVRNSMNRQICMCMPCIYIWKRNCASKLTYWTIPIFLHTYYIWAVAFIYVKLKGPHFYRHPLRRLKRFSIPTCSSKNGDLVFQRLACLSYLMNLTKWKMMRTKIFVFSAAHSLVALLLSRVGKCCHHTLPLHRIRVSTVHIRTQNRAS